VCPRPVRTKVPSREGARHKEETQELE
jgi:hypothetical protein